jgi:hypothetical protein
MRTSFRVVVVVVIGLGLLAGGPAALAAGKPETFTEHEDNFTDTFTDVVCINGTDQEAVISIVENGVFHGTFFDDGTLHVTGTFVGTFSADPVDPSLPTYTGRYTGWFGENQNSNIDNITFTFSARGSAPDGSKVNFGSVEHLTASSIEFVEGSDEPIVSGLRSEVEVFRCA